MMSQDCYDFYHDDCEDEWGAWCTCSCHDEEDEEDSIVTVDTRGLL